MAEDAFGYEDGQSDELKRKRILIVDDINDSGATFKWIQDDWQSGCLPRDPSWLDIWGNNVRTAVLINNDASEFKDVNYVGHNINKQEIDIWCVFPWEHWWR
jgi:hypoxanthine phosphoribosyltransferase